MNARHHAPPSAKITLHLSAHDRIIALPSGTGRRWAETALDLSDFTKSHDQTRTLALGDQARARQALTHLHQAASDCQVTIVTHPRPYLGDIAETIVAALPGHWMADVEPLLQEHAPHYLRDFLWETGEIYDLLDRAQPGFVASLRDGGGTELLLVERPSDGAYMVGALTLSPDYLDVTAPAPRSVIASDARLAARITETRLLPDYERAVHLSGLERSGAGPALGAGQAGAGGVQRRGPAGRLYRFRDHAVAVFAALRDNTTLSAEQTTFLDRMENGLNLDAPDDPDPETLADAEAVWLVDGQELIEMARAATPAPVTPPGPRRGIPHAATTPLYRSTSSSASPPKTSIPPSTNYTPSRHSSHSFTGATSALGPKHLPQMPHRPQQSLRRAGVERVPRSSSAMWRRMPIRCWPPRGVPWTPCLRPDTMPRGGS
ncbi:hypothetical protein [Streptomyces sp. NPDC017988]|uniref:hypothetical protein n=1 Tax=Streptomyces sp. NPDC017988 TaxID=3365025 RepID=UPI0037947F8F